MKKFLMVMVLGLVLCGCENADNDVDNSGNNGDNSVVDTVKATDLYDKYVNYSNLDINAYNNIDVNEDNSNEYMVKLAIYNIIKDNNVNIQNYEWNNEGLYEEGWSNGYKITIQQIEDYINKLFNVNKFINYSELDLTFYGDISVYYYSSENAYRMIADSSIPKSGSDFEAYSKFVSSEVNGDNVIVYSNYFGIISEMGNTVIDSNGEGAKTYGMCYENSEICPTGNLVDYVTNNLTDYVGKFKHTFTKKADGNYYWVSTEKVNN